MRERPQERVARLEARARSGAGADAEMAEQILVGMADDETMAANVAKAARLALQRLAGARCAAGRNGR